MNKKIEQKRQKKKLNITPLTEKLTEKYQKSGVDVPLQILTFHISKSISFLLPVFFILNYMQFCFTPNWTRQHNKNLKKLQWKKEKLEKLSTIQ
jgi:hypothetical protein